MDEIEIYRIKLKEIADFAFGFGVKTIGIEQFNTGTPDTWDKRVRDKFLVACHDGFKTAQNILIGEINKYQILLRETNKNLKEFRRQRDK
jgi:hypothetical protein